jgi:riboflavin kinase/FMN adenylyltransferase
LADLEPEEFIQNYLANRLAVRHVVMGYDFHFGRGRRGSPATIRTAGARFGFGTTIVDQVSDEGDAHSPFSSSAIRQALHHGNMADAAHDLGYNWMVMGEVVKGDQRGQTIGFPTLNIILDQGADPFRGIYAVRVRDASLKGAIAWPGAGYFGDRPTFDTGRTFLEVFLIGFSGNLYGRTLLIEMVDLIRPDRRFDTLPELVAQMRTDCDDALSRLNGEAKTKPLASYPLAQLQKVGEI